MVMEKVTKLNQDLASVNKKIEVRRTRSSGEKPIVVLDPCYPSEGLRINTSTDYKVFDFDVHNGQLELWGTDGSHVNKQTGTISTGINGNGASIHLNDETGTNTIRIIGGDGTIYGANADLAENFACTQKHDDDVNSEGYGYILDAIEPGDVLVVSDNGTLVKCEKEYDSRVVGVVSGAKDYKPAIVLDEFALSGTESNYPGKGVFPVALAGKVFCWVTGEVKAGDLLVTSSKEGMAMRADTRDPGKLTGTILGKALASGRGLRKPVLIPILVMLG